MIAEDNVSTFSCLVQKIPGSDLFVVAKKNGNPLFSHPEGTQDDRF